MSQLHPLADVENGKLQKKILMVTFVDIRPN